MWIRGVGEGSRSWIYGIEYNRIVGDFSEDSGESIRWIKVVM